MFERLLAALIILALLVLVMFIALPDSGRINAPAVNRSPAVEPAVPPSESARVKPPAAEGQTEVAKNEAAPPPPEKPAASPQEVQVPNPPGNSSVDTGKKAPAPVEKGEREIGSSETPPKQKLVKSNYERLPPDKELPAKPIETAKADKPAEKPVPAMPKADKLKVHKSKIDRPRTETVSRLPVRRPGPRGYIKEYRERDDDIGEYIQRTDYSRPDWHRTHYYECANGRCDCSCDRPYWARRGPPCWD
jgi:hypothetical protein